MTSESMARVTELFAKARDLAPTQREAYLTAACGTDGSVRAEVDSLLRCQPETSGFLEQPAFDLGLEVLADALSEGELSPGEMLGDCRVLSLLGVGGMGEVYLAQDTVLDRRVALKLIQRAGGSSLLRHFRHERRVLAALNHPNIARLYGSGVSPDGRAYLVIEYVEGQRLDEYCDGRRLAISERLALFRKVCSAVAYAHQNLVIHRDLKPANIRVTPDGEPKLLDFGIAKLLEPEMATASALLSVTLTMQGAMTPEYASPEQLRGETITTASDVYSLGVVLYELLCGQRPHPLKGHRPDELARAICEQEPVRLSTAVQRVEKGNLQRLPEVSREKWRRRLKGDLDNIVAKALRKEPGRRYPSVAQLSDDIDRHLQGLPVEARGDSFAYRAGKFVRRHRAATAAAALGVLALVVGLVATSLQRNRAQLAQAQAERLNGFLQVLLGSANPENGPGRDLRVIQVLDQASGQLDHELSAEPVVLAQAHLTVGQAYAGLKEAIPAIQHLRAAVAIDRRLYGDENVTTAHAKAMLGLALQSLERHTAESEPLLREALAVERRQPTAEQRDLPVILSGLSYVMMARNQIDAAESFTHEALARTRQTNGEASIPYAQQLNQLGVLLLNKHDYPGAENPFRQSVAIYRQQGMRKAGYPDVLTHLAFDLILQEKLAEPESMLHEAQACYEGTAGQKNIAYYFDLGLLGLLHFMQGNYAAAAEEMRENSEEVAALVPADDEDVVGGQIVLGVSLTRLGKAVEGEPYLRESLRLAKLNHFGGTLTAPDYLEVALGECLLAQKRYAEAEGPLLTGDDDLKKRLGEKNKFTVHASALLHELYLAWGRPDEAARFIGTPANPPAKLP